MISTHHVTETGHPVQQELPERKETEKPYATLWLAGKEVQLFENEEGEFFTA